VALGHLGVIDSTVMRPPLMSVSKAAADAVVDALVAAGLA
jgi:dihydrodipicolinate synthase/N-acetylneuraminate lyase